MSELRVAFVKIRGVAQAVIRRYFYAEQQHFCFVILTKLNQLLEIVAQAANLKAAQAIVGAELDHAR